MFWLAALFPQWLAVAAATKTGNSKATTPRRRSNATARETAEETTRRRGEMGGCPRDEDVGDGGGGGVGDEDVDAREGDDDDDEAGIDPKRRGWNWPSFALPPGVSRSRSRSRRSRSRRCHFRDLRDAEIEWHSQTNPDNDSRVDYDATVDAALRASVRRHKRQNRKLRAYWAGDADASRTTAKPVDDLKRDDDVDRTIGPTWKAASRVDAELVD